MGRKIKTSINIDEDLWREFQHYVIEKYGSSRKLSIALEDLIRKEIQE